jgi:hypothetical protein
VWAYGANFPQPSLTEGICERGECTLIGIRERYADGSVDCALKTFVNVETGRVDDVQYSKPCDEDDPSSRLEPSDYRALLSKRTAIGYELAASHPRVMKIVEESMFHQRNFEMLERRDVVTIETAKSMSVTGTWQEGYEFTLSGRKMITVDIVQDAITSVNVMPLADEREYWNFTDNQKRMISIAVSYTELERILEGMSDGTDYYVSAIRDWGMGDLGYVVISSSTNREVNFLVTINQVTGEIVKDKTP